MENKLKEYEIVVTIVESVTGRADTYWEDIERVQAILSNLQKQRDKEVKIVKEN